MAAEKDKLEDEKRRWHGEAQSLRNKYEVLVGKPRDPVDMREDQNLYRENRIAEME